MTSRKWIALENAVADAITRVDEAWRVWQELVKEEADEERRITPRAAVMSLLKLARDAERKSSGNIPTSVKARNSEPPPRNLMGPSEAPEPMDTGYSLDASHAYGQLKKAFDGAKTPGARERVRKIAHRLVAQGLVSEQDVAPFLRGPRGR